ncbi:MAG: XdhC family protein [Chloroflexi bacterium]|nr:XdhC family protein [Chloroflexota bacterium]
MALATVVSAWRSVPRAVGAKMALTLEEKIAGSVSGGCVERAVDCSNIQIGAIE